MTCSNSTTAPSSEYVEGISLAAHLASGPLPVEQAAGRRLGAVADAAAAAANAKCPLIA
jgi:hypothetical protein